MKPLDLSQTDHPIFKFIYATDLRINGSVAWLAECKRCHKQLLVGSSQVKRGTHNRCIHCEEARTHTRRTLHEPI